MNCYDLNINWSDVSVVNIINVFIFRQEATSALADFQAGPPSWWNWNLEMLRFVEGAEPENLEKKRRSKARTNNNLKPHMAPSPNQTRATLVGGEWSHHCANPAPPTL